VYRPDSSEKKKGGEKLKPGVTKESAERKHDLRTTHLNRGAAVDIGKESKSRTTGGKQIRLERIDDGGGTDNKGAGRREEISGESKGLSNGGEMGGKWGGGGRE